MIGGQAADIIMANGKWEKHKNATRIERLIDTIISVDAFKEYKLNKKTIISSMKKDKKNKENKITFILPKKIGTVGMYRDVPVKMVEKVIAGL